MLPDPSWKTRDNDPINQMVKDMTPEEFVSWMVEHHGLPDNDYAKRIIISNLTEQFHWHRLRGRLDRHPWLAALAELWLRTKTPPTPAPAPTPLAAPKCPDCNNVIWPRTPSKCPDCKNVVCTCPRV